MSDLTQIAEAIHDAMQAVDQAREAGQSLREDVNHQTFNAFRARMAELEEHLSTLQTALEDERAYAADELMDALSVLFSGHRAEYRRTPRMQG